MQGDPNAPSLRMGFSRDVSPLGKLHSSHSSSSQGLPAGQLSQASKPICQPEELWEKPDFQSGCYWILFITFAKLSRASLLIYLLL